MLAQGATGCLLGVSVYVMLVVSVSFCAEFCHVQACRGRLGLLGKSRRKRGKSSGHSTEHDLGG